eukprot:265607_1
MKSEYYVIFAVTAMSIIFTVGTSAIAIYLIRHFLLVSDTPKLPRALRNLRSNMRSRTTSNCNSPDTENAFSRANSLRNGNGNSPRNSPRNSGNFKLDSFRTNSLRSERTNSLQKASAHMQHEVRIAKFFKITASISLVFNALNALFNSIYCLYLIWDPMETETDPFYIHHPSHIQRITSTFSWYIAKVALVWFFSGRLYYAFKGSCLQTNKRTIIIVNIINTIFAPLTLTVAYWAVYAHELYVAEFCFNIWRLFYQIIVFTILYMFSKRLLLLNVLHKTISLTRTPSARDNQLTPQHKSQGSRHKSVASVQNIENIRYARTISHQRSFSFEQQERSYAKFMQIVTRNAVLVLTISVIVLLVTLCFSGFRFVFGPQTRLTLLIPMNMAAFDSLVTSVCIICWVQIGDSVQANSCGKCGDAK